MPLNTRTFFQVEFAVKLQSSFRACNISVPVLIFVVTPDGDLRRHEVQQTARKEG